MFSSCTFWARCHCKNVHFLKLSPAARNTVSGTVLRTKPFVCVCVQKWKSWTIREYPFTSLWTSKPTCPFKTCSHGHVENPVLFFEAEAVHLQKSCCSDGEGFNVDVANVNWAAKPVMGRVYFQGRQSCAKLPSVSWLHHYRILHTTKINKTYDNGARTGSQMRECKVWAIHSTAACPTFGFCASFHTVWLVRIPDFNVEWLCVAEFQRQKCSRWSISCVDHSAAGWAYITHIQNTAFCKIRPFGQKMLFCSEGCILKKVSQKSYFSGSRILYIWYLCVSRSLSIAHRRRVVKHGCKLRILTVCVFDIPHLRIANL